MNLEAELSQMAEENLVYDQESRQEDLRDSTRNMRIPV